MKILSPQTNSDVITFSVTARLTDARNRFYEPSESLGRHRSIRPTSIFIEYIITEDTSNWNAVEAVGEEGLDFIELNSVLRCRGLADWIVDLSDRMLAVRAIDSFHKCQTITYSDISQALVITCYLVALDSDIGHPLNRTNIRINKSGDRYCLSGDRKCQTESIHCHPQNAVLTCTNTDRVTEGAQFFRFRCNEITNNQYWLKKRKKPLLGLIEEKTEHPRSPGTKVGTNNRSPRSLVTKVGTKK